MSSDNQYELYSSVLDVDEGTNPESQPWQNAIESTREPPFALRQSDGTVWAALNTEHGTLDRLPGPQGAEFAFRVLQRRFSTDLAMMTCRHDVHVNGLPALKLTLLTTKDLIRLAPGHTAYVTERVTPYVGVATEEHIGRKCPYCKLKITKGMRVATCRCSAVYHLEDTGDSSDSNGDDPLKCADELQTCLACGNELLLNEHLLWDPAEL